MRKRPGRTGNRKMWALCGCDETSTRIHVHRHPFHNYTRSVTIADVGTKGVSDAPDEEENVIPRSSSGIEEFLSGVEKLLIPLFIELCPKVLL